MNSTPKITTQAPITMGNQTLYFMSQYARGTPATVATKVAAVIWKNA